MENRNILIGLGTGLVAGFMLGYGTGTYFSQTGASGAVAAPAATQPPPSPLPGQNPVEVFTRITATRAALEREPGNVDAWILLGNDCFDTHQPQAAVDAYARALALAPGHPHLADILTDQGVMYRELKAYDKALANFKRASAADPTHLPSILNEGVVYGLDLHDKAAARKAWNRVIQMAPTSSQAEQARKFLAGLG